MRVRQRAVLVLQLPEQPHVLDRNDGLVGEGLEQRYFLVGKCACFAARNGNRPDGLALAQHRNGDDASKAAKPRYFTRSWSDPWVGLCVCHERWSSIADGSRVAPRVAGNRTRVLSSHCFIVFSVPCRQGCQMKRVADHPGEGRAVAGQQPLRALNDRVENRLLIGRRAGDHPQDCAGGGLLGARLRKQLLGVANPDACIPARLAGDPTFLGLVTATHRSLLASPPTLITVG